MKAFPRSIKRFNMHILLFKEKEKELKKSFTTISQFLTMTAPIMEIKITKPYVINENNNVTLNEFNLAIASDE